MSEQPFSPDFQTNNDFETKELNLNQQNNNPTGATIYPATNISRLNYFRPLDQQPVNNVYRYQQVNELGKVLNI
jgi:hypothetical protein